MEIIKALTRVYVATQDFEATIRFYENLLKENDWIRFIVPDAGIEVAAIGPFLIVTGPDECLTPLLDTKITLLVDSLDGYRTRLLNQGAEILEEPKPVPTGRSMRVRHPDGMICEYVEFDGF